MRARALARALARPLAAALIALAGMAQAETPPEGVRPEMFAQLQAFVAWSELRCGLSDGICPNVSRARRLAQQIMAAAHDCYTLQYASSCVLAQEGVFTADAIFWNLPQNAPTIPHQPLLDGWEAFLAEYRANRP